MFQWTLELDEALKSFLVSFLATTRFVIVIIQDSHVLNLSLLRIQLFSLLTTYCRFICLLGYGFSFCRKRKTKERKASWIHIWNSVFVERR